MKISDRKMKTEKLRFGNILIEPDTGRLLRDGQEVVLTGLTWRLLLYFVRHEKEILDADELIRAVWGEQSDGVSNESLVQRIKLLRAGLGDEGQNPRYIRTIRGRGYQFAASVRQQESSGRRRAGFLTGAAIAAGLVLAVGLNMDMSTDNSSNPQSQAMQAEADLMRLIDRGYDYLGRLQSDDNERAIALFRDALDRDPDNERAVVGLSIAYAHRSSKFHYPIEWAVRGEAMMREAIRNGLDSAAGWHALALTLDVQDKIDEALENYERALALAPQDAAILASAAYLYQVRGELARALDYGLRAYDIDPDLAYGEVQIARVYHLLEADAQARLWLDRAVSLHPDAVFAHLAKAQTAFAHGRFDAAQAAIRAGEAEGIERAEYFLLRGLIAETEGKPDQAHEFYQQASDLDPGRDIGKVYSLRLALGPEQKPIRETARALLSDMETARDNGRINPAFMIDAAALALTLGERQRTLDHLRIAIADGFRDWRFLNRDPRFEHLHGTPAYAGLVADIRRRIADERQKTASF